MKRDEKYTEVLRHLKEQTPQLDDKNGLTEEIINRIRKPVEVISGPNKIQTCLFAWVGNYWLRGSMAIIAVVFIALFVVQQAGIAKRLENIEKQLVKSENSFIRADQELGTMQKAILKMVVVEKDSITVSRSDLEAFMNSYLELQRSNENFRKNSAINKSLHKNLRKQTERNISTDES